MFATIALLAALQGGHAAPAAGAPSEDVTKVEAAAQAAAGPGAPAAHAGEEEKFDILHDIMDAREIKLPGGAKIHLPPAHSWQVGPLDLTPTKHVVFLWITALVVLAIFIPAAQAAKRARQQPGVPRRHHNLIEALVLFLRDQVVMPNIGHGGEKFVPFLVTVFFFILVSNLLGLLPWGATPTGNISVTAALAILSFLVIEGAGIAAQRAHYLNTIVYWNKDLALPIRLVLAVIMTPVELLGKLTKPFALAIRLFANMTAGHILLLAIISLIFVFGSWFIAVGPVVMGVALFFLEIFVAFLQAFIFTLLSSVFIGLIRHAH